ncbi:MAG: hypothetical protein LQ350_000259 [Teloschistes chrysophthalmus]|nr:MAG: hypothetical protein LQ350_000259 [Niorma chrysophthalma]
MDGGGTRLHVYRWLEASKARKDADEKHLHSLPELKTQKKWTQKVHPGVSTFGEKPDRIGPDHLQKFFDHALAIVPKAAVPETPIFLLATAGMRLLPDSQRSRLLAEMCSYARSKTEFLIPDCTANFQVIPGSTEGLYGWVAANYLLGGFDSPKDHDHGKGHHTYGFLDMGGASAQIAFAPNATEAERHANDLTLLRLRTVDGAPAEYRVFVTTWLEYGVHEARRRYVERLVEESGQNNPEELHDPCLPKGLSTTTKGDILLPGSKTVAGKIPSLLGTGDFKECLKKTFPLLDKDAPCEDEPCLLHGVHVPAIDFDVNHFVGVSEYWHTTHEVFEMAHKDKAYDFRTYQERVIEFCSKDWHVIQEGVQKHTFGKKVDEGRAIEVCFKASWLINILHEGIGIPRVGVEGLAPSGHNGTKEVLANAKNKGFTDSFQAVDKIADTEVSWTLGKMVIYASSQVQPKGDSLPVGFGSNVAGLPEDFQFGGLAKGTFTNSTGEKGWHDTLFSGDSPRRVPGFLFFVVIICVATFLLCGRERRQRAYSKLGLNTNHRPGPAKRRGLFGSKLPFFRSKSSHVAYERVLEDGPAAEEFALGPLEGDEDNHYSDSSASSGSRAGRASGLATPRIHESGSQDFYEHSNSSQNFGLGISGNAMGRSGLTGRTDSKDKLAGMMGPLSDTMPLFQRLRQSIGGFLTPQRPSQRCPQRSETQRQPTKSPSLEQAKQRLDRQSANPSKRTAEWLRKHSADIKTPKGVRGSRVVKPTPSPRQSSKAKGKSWAHVLPNWLVKQPVPEKQDSLEGTTVFGFDESPSQSPGLDNDATLIEAAARVGGEKANAALFAPEEEDQIYTPTAEDLEVMKTWSNDEVWTFHKLNMRGFEPLVPETWAMEFETLSDEIFSEDDSEWVIKAHEGSEYNACRALQNLFGLGGRVRDRITCKLRPEEALRRELLAYHKWTIMDAGLSRIDHIPMVAIGTAAHRESVDSVVGRVTDQLHELGRQYRAELYDYTDPVRGEPVYTRDLPTLYGAVITFSIVTFLTYDSNFPGKQVQSMGSYDFSNLQQDVWHAFAVAIVFVKARDYLIMLKDSNLLGTVLEDEDEDCDA